MTWIYSKNFIFYFFHWLKLLPSQSNGVVHQCGLKLPPPCLQKEYAKVMESVSEDQCTFFQGLD